MHREHDRSPAPPQAHRVDGAEFRRVLGHLATGVTVITAWGTDAPLGMAANSVVSVSLDPPLVLFCPARTSTTWPLLRAAEGLCINVMAGHHGELTRRFGARGVDRFAGLSLTGRRAGPALDDAVAWIDCTLEQEHPAGDHTIAVARVQDMAAAAGAEPLVFFRGQYGSFIANGELPAGSS